MNMHLSISAPSCAGHNVSIQRTQKMGLKLAHAPLAFDLVSAFLGSFLFSRAAEKRLVKQRVTFWTKAPFRKSLMQELTFWKLPRNEKANQMQLLFKQLSNLSSVVIMLFVELYRCLSVTVRKTTDTYIGPIYSSQFFFLHHCIVSHH